MTQDQSPAAGASRKTTRARRAKPRCEDCYFNRRMLCALDLGGPCSTFRADSPDGLVPPAQPTLLVRSEPSQAETRPEPAILAA